MQIDVFGSFIRKVKDDYRDSIREVETAGKGRRAPSDGIYDSAQWHYRVGFLKKVPKEQGATHIAFFFRWCLSRQLVSPALLAQHQQALEDLQQGKLSYPAFVVQHLEGILSRQALSPLGQAFADVYYTTQANPFSPQLGNYIQDYEELVHVLYRLNGAEYYCVKDIEENYAKVSSMLEEKYSLFQQLQGQLSAANGS